MELTDQFWLPVHTTANLRAMPDYYPKRACREVFRMWLEGGDDLLMPKTWNSVIKVMGAVGEARLGRYVLAVLTGQ